MAFTYVTVQAVYETADDQPARGRVEFTPVDQMHNGLTIVAATIGDDLDAAGAMSVRLAATTDPATTPVGVTYRVVEKIAGQPGRTYYVSVPHNQGSTLQLANLTVLTASGAAGFALRNATDYDDATPPTDGQVMAWNATTSKYRPVTGGGGGAVASVNGQTGAVSITASGLGAQPIDTDLTAIAALAPADGSYLGRQAGAWTGRTAAQVKTDLGLDQVSNTSDAAKPLSTAATAALAAKAPTASPVFTGTPTGPRFVTAPAVLTASAGAITPDASASSQFRHTATAAVTLNDPTGGVDGQVVTVAVLASGANRVLTLASGLLAPITVTAGQWWVGQFVYNSATGAWLPIDTLASSGGSGGAVASVNGLTGAVVLTPDSFTDGTTNHVFTAADDTKLAGIAAGATVGIPATLLDAKGDLVTATAADTAARLPVGTNGQVLVADSTAALGLRWLGTGVYVATGDDSDLAGALAGVPSTVPSTFLVAVKVAGT